MLNGYVQMNDIDPFKLGNSLLQNPSQISFDETLEKALETQAKEASRDAKDKAVDAASETVDAKKKKAKANNPDKLPDVTKITSNNDRNSSNETRNTYLLLEKFKEKKKFFDDEQKSPRQQLMENANVVGNPMLQQVSDQPRQRATKAQILSAWEKFAPTVTEDITKRAVRIDIPLINDVQAIVLKMHPDKSLTASLLGSLEMGELAKQHKDKLDKNLRHHHLSLKKFNS